MQNNLFICDWLITSFIDFPGSISSVIYLRGCNLRCPYCHNPNLVINNFFKNNKPIEDFITLVKRREKIIEGIVITGGEPTCYPSLNDLINYIKSNLKNIKIKIDTNGLRPEIIRKLDIDYCALDLKAHPKDYHLLGCTQNISKIEEHLLDSIDIIKSFKENGEIRITTAKPFISIETIKYFSNILRGVSKIYLQPFSTKKEILNKFTNHCITLSPTPLNELLEYKNILKKVSNICEIRQI
jgi:pyruvate formate lyase activating enzyme